ncbi:hypothetical protein COCOBI_04-3960 [Coccomyxa sp. Obi]|nr:hypothetical protein COCOBI_04-3960 [Coccomyxa sp. Obi]
MGGRVNRVDVASLDRGVQLLGRERSRSPAPRPPPSPANPANDLESVCNVLETKLVRAPVKIPPQVFATLKNIKEAADEEVVKKMRDLSFELKLDQLKALAKYVDGIEALCAKLDA